MTIEGVNINSARFAEAIDQLVTDRELRALLEENPTEALAQMGLEVDDARRAQLAGKRLSEVIVPARTGVSEGGLGQVAETYVHVGVSVAVEVAVSVVVGAEVDNLKQVIIQRNLETIRQHGLGGIG